MTTEARDVQRDDLRVVPDPDGGPHEAMGLLERAARVAEDTVDEARATAERLISSARESAQQLEREAREEADRTRGQAIMDAERVRGQADHEAEHRLAEARSELAGLEDSVGRLRLERDSAAEAIREIAARLMDAGTRAMP